MKPARLINLVGFVLIAVAVILHIVCLATPYYAKMDTDSLLVKVKKFIEERKPQQGTPDNGPSSSMYPSPEYNSENRQATMDPEVELQRPGHGSMSRMSIDDVTDNDLNDFVGTRAEIGLWEFCASVETKETVLKKCVSFGLEFTADEVETPFWLNVVRGLSIISLLLMVKSAIGSLICLLVHSKGDRLRLMPYILAFFCAGAGGLALLGDIIFASKLSALYKDIAPHDPSMPSFVVKLYDLMSQYLIFSWGFSLDIVASVVAILAGLVHLAGVKFSRSDRGSQLISSEEL